ncbi:MAG: hypothetical protein HY340_03590 [Candidatus Kerfeldbacteria bacterium]|nr:hypothetical protein [Candidatus Kerfeldbacteria bacterium]
MDDRSSPIDGENDARVPPQIIPVSSLFPRSRIEEAVNGSEANDWTSVVRVFDRCVAEIERGEPLIILPSHIAMLPSDEHDAATIADVLLQYGAGRYTARYQNHGMYVWLLRV